MALYYQKGKLVIADWGKRRNMLISVLLSLGVIVFSLTYWYGYDAGKKKFTPLVAENEGLQLRFTQLEAETVELRQQVARLTSSREIDQQALLQVHNIIKQLEVEKSDVERELHFYKRILVPKDMQKGVRIEDFTLRRDGGSNEYQLGLVLVQFAANTPFLRGNITITLVGAQHGKATKLNLSSLVKEGAFNNSLGFRYFQQWPQAKECLTFDLPADFLPKQIEVVVQMTQGSKQRVEKTYEWSEELVDHVQ